MSQIPNPIQSQYGSNMPINPSQINNSMYVQPMLSQRDQIYFSQLSSYFQNLEEKKGGRNQSSSPYRDMNFGNRDRNHMSSIDPKQELRLQKMGKKLHRSLFRSARFEETKEGFIIKQVKITKEGKEEENPKKRFPISFTSIQKFARTFKKKTPNNLLKWHKDEHSYRINYQTPNRKGPLALYFDHQTEAYEFLVKSDVRVKGLLKRILEDYKRRKDEARMFDARATLLDKIRLFAEKKKRLHLGFLEESDQRMTKQLISVWLKMSKALEVQRHRLALEEKKKPENEEDVPMNEEKDEFEESRKLIEQRMREREEQERQAQLEEMNHTRLMQYVKSIQKNQAFLDCNRFHLNRLAREWRRVAVEKLQKQKEIEQTAKTRPESKSIYIKVLEVNQNVLPVPVFSLSLVVTKGNTPSFRPLSAKHDKNSSNPNSQGVYHEQQFALRVSGQAKNVKLICNQKNIQEKKSQILWEVKPESNLTSWNLGINSKDNRKFEDPKDLLELSIINEDHNESSLHFKAEIKIADFLKETDPLKIYYVSLGRVSDHKPDYNAALEPLVKFKVFLGNNPPNEGDWSQNLIQTIKKDHFIKDPVYEEIIKLPKYSPKNLGFLIEILTEWGLFDIEMKYKRLVGEIHYKRDDKNLDEEGSQIYFEEKNKPQERKKALLQEIIEALYDFTIDETSKSHARGQGNYKKFLEFEHLTTHFLTQFKENNQKLQYNSHESDENRDYSDEENPEEAQQHQVKLLKFRSRNKGKIDKKDVELLDEICRKGGVPNQKRPFLWSFLGNVEEIKLKAVNLLNKLDGINKYEDKNKQKGVPSNHFTNIDESISLRSFYKVLLDRARPSDICYLVRQQIADDIALVNEIEDYANQDIQDPLNNILSALSFLIHILKSFEPSNPSKENRKEDEEKNNHIIFYSMPILKIARKIISIINSRYLDPEQMNLNAFNNGNDIDSPSKDKHNSENQMANDKEYLAFWMLVSMVTYVLPGYFLASPHILNDEIKTPLRESYQDEIGLKRDLLILKLFIKEQEPAIFQLFEDISLPLEFFYGNMLLAAGSDMVHNEALYRIWDIMFLQKERDQDPYLILIALIVLLLRISKPHILRNSEQAFETKHASKDSREINDVIKIFETVSRFLPNPDDVIDELFKIHDSLVKFIRNEFGVFNNLRNELNNKFQSIRHQNKMVYDLVHFKNNFVDIQKNLGNNEKNLGVYEIFNLLDKLKKKHKLFGLSYVEETDLKVPQEFDEVENTAYKDMKAVLQRMLWFKHFDEKNDPNMIIHVFLHKLTLFVSREEKPFKLEVKYQNESKCSLPLEFNTTCYLNHYLQIPYNKKGSHEISIQITQEREEKKAITSPQAALTTSSFKELGTKNVENISVKHEIIIRQAIIKEAVINLDSLLVNYLQKGIAKLDIPYSEMDNKDFYDFNLTTSEIDYSIVLATEQKDGNDERNESSFRNNAKILAQSLPKPLFKVETFEKIKAVNLEKFHEKFLKSLINVLGLDHISNASFAINPNEWRKNSKITYDDFRQTLKECKFLEGSNIDYFALYNSIMNANRDKSFYFSDFLILLILFSHTTPKQKTLLLYETLLLFDNTRDLCNGVSILSVKSLVSYLYEVFMLSMPHHQVDNIIEYLNDGFVSGVLSAKVDYKTADKNQIMTMNFTNTLIHISNYLHYYYNTKQIFLGDPLKLTFLKEILENLNEETPEILDSLPENELLRLNLKFRAKGLKHKMQILFDKNWEIKRKLVLDPEVDELKILTPERYKLVETLLLQNENVIPLGNIESFLSKNQFILLMERLPMMNYFLSFSIMDNNQTNLPRVSCTIRLDNELIGHIDELSIKNLEAKAEREDNNAQYKDKSYEWNQKRQAISDQRSRSYGSKPSSLYFEKFPFYESFFNTLKLIQITLMKYFLQEESQSNYPQSSLIPSNQVQNSSLLSASSRSPQIRRKAPEYSKIFDIDFRKTIFEISCAKPVFSGVFYCSLFDLAWFITSGGLKFGELNLNIKYFSKNHERMGTIPRRPDIVQYDPFKRFEAKYQCMALFYYSYQSKEWLPCKIIKRFFSTRKKQNKSSHCSYFGVVFQSEPDRMYLKRMHEIYIPTFVDVTELEEAVLKDLEDKVNVSIKDVTSTKFQKKIPETPNSEAKKDISTMKEEAHKQANVEPQELLKTFNKNKTKEDEREREGPLSTRSVKTDPIVKSSFSKNAAGNFERERNNFDYRNLHDIRELNDESMRNSANEKRKGSFKQQPLSASNKKYIKY